MGSHFSKEDFSQFENKIGKLTYYPEEIKEVRQYICYDGGAGYVEKRMMRHSHMFEISFSEGKLGGTSSFCYIGKFFKDKEEVKEKYFDEGIFSGFKIEEENVEKKLVFNFHYEGKIYIITFFIGENKYIFTSDEKPQKCRTSRYTLWSDP